MSVASLSSARVPLLLSGNMLLQSMQSSQSALLKVQQQLSTGNRLTLPSDDPTAAVGILNLKQQIAANDQYSSNLGFAAGFLGQADSSLGSLSTLVTQAQSIANSEVGATASAADRSAQAQVVDSLVQQAMQLGNAQYQGQYVFGGQNTVNAPFTQVNGGYLYNGSATQQGILTADGQSLDYTVDGNVAFGGTSAQVTGTANLAPALTATTRLSDLAGARLQRVATGPVNVTVGGTTVSVDLSQASTAGDVTSILNAALATAGSDATVDLSGGGLVVNGDSTQSLTIADTSGGTTAADLGIAGTVAAGGTLTSVSLGAKVTATTPLASLNNGAGIDPSGIIITNGSTSATITLAGPPALSTVGDLLNAINGSGTHITASIDPSGETINLNNPLSGSPMTVGENGGATAQQLGIRTMNPATTLSDLNAGAGITPISLTEPGPSGSIVVTDTAGNPFSVKMDGVTTPSQLIAAINSATGNTTVTAALNATGNGITLTDTAGGGGNLTVSGGPDYSGNGSTLGIFQTGSGATLTGTAMTFSTDDFRISRRDGTSFTVNLTGATTVQDALDRINNADGNTVAATKVTASMNPTGNGIELTDASAGPNALTVTAVNGSTVAAGLGIATSSATGVINGGDVNPVEPQGIFSSLAMLRDALAANDTAGIQRAAALLQADGTRATTAQGIVGAREQDIANRQSSVTSEQTQLKSSLSTLSDTDMTTAITQFEQLQTAYQAALETAQKTQNMSLLDFLT